MPATITTATASQWRKIDELRERCISKQTEQPNDEAVRDVVLRMWKSMKQELPAVIILDSPLATVLGAAICQSMAETGKQLYSQLDSQLGSHLRSQLYSQLGSHLRSQLYSQLYSQLGSQLDSQLRSQLDSQLRSQLRSQLGSLPEIAKKQPWYLSVYWAAWSGWHEGGEILGVKFDRDNLVLFVDWCDRIPMIVPYEGIAFVSRKPSEIHWRDRRLHNEAGMSVKFRDGWGIYSLEGVAVDEQIVMRPETQTIEQINSEANEEIRRIRIDRFGWHRYLEKSRAKVVASRLNQRDAQQEQLYTLNGGARRFVCVDPSTGRKYALGVPREVDSCEGAQNYISHGLDQYSLHRS